MYNGHWESSKPHAERRAITEHFCWGNTITTAYKTRKTNSDFCLNFYASEAHKKVRGVQQL